MQYGLTLLIVYWISMLHLNQLDSSSKMRNASIIQTSFNFYLKLCLFVGFQHTQIMGLQQRQGKRTHDLIVIID